MKVYLSGAMTGRTKEEMEAWRTEFTKKWIGSVDNPFTRFGVDNPVVKDVQALVGCDALVLYHIGPSDGSAMELLYAYNENIPTVVIDTTGLLSPWIVYHCDHVVNSIDEAIAYLDGIFKGE